MNNKYSIQEGLESLDRIRLMMDYQLDKTLNENYSNLGLLNEITKGDWYGCIEDVNTIIGKGITNVNVKFGADQVVQFNKDGTAIIYKLDSNGFLSVLFKGKWSCNKTKGYTIKLEDGNVYDSNKKNWTSPNPKKTFKLPSSPTTSQKTTTKSEWSIYEPVKQNGKVVGYKLNPQDMSSVVVQKPTGSYWAKDLYPNKKPDEYPNNSELTSLLVNPLNLNSISGPGGIVPIDQKIQQQNQQKEFWDKIHSDGEKRERYEKLKVLRKQALDYRMPMAQTAWLKPGVKEEYEELEDYFERGGFPPSGNLRDTPQPKEPEIVGKYISTPGARNKMKWQYVRYENKEPVTYTFEDYYKGEEWNRYNQRYEEDLRKWSRDDSVHNLITIASIGALFLPGGLYLSTAIQLGDAALYYKEGDSFMGGLHVIFAVLPFASEILPAFKKLSGPALRRVSKWIRGGGKGTLAAEEKELAEQIIKNEAKLKVMEKSAANVIFLKNMFSKLNPIKGIKLIIELTKKYPKLTSIFGTLIQVKGVAWTYEKFYNEYQKANLSKDKQKLEFLKNTYDEQVKGKIDNKLENLTENDMGAIGINPDILNNESCIVVPEAC